MVKKTPEISGADVVESTSRCVSSNPGAGEPAGNKAAVELWIADHRRAVVEFEPGIPREWELLLGGSSHLVSGL